MKTTRIIQMVRRSEQGQTRPFLCRDNDGHLYFAKGLNSGWDGLCREYVATRLAQCLNLPVATVCLLDIPPALVEEHHDREAQDLGTGIVFGSRDVSSASENVDELRWSEVESIPIELRAAILLFDWWVCNSDRILSEKGGNPNLLWASASQELHVIDHNNAFASAENMADFWDDHIFREARDRWDEAWRQMWQTRLSATLEQLETVWDEMPLEWVDQSAESGGLTLEKAHALLQRCRDKPDFWDAS